MGFTRETFPEGTRRAEADIHHGFCRVKGCFRKIHSFHHRVPNTKANRKRFPLFIQSQLNCAGLCFEHHEGHSTAGVDISEKEAEVYELFLQELAGQGRAVR